MSFTHLLTQPPIRACHCVGNDKYEHNVHITGHRIWLAYPCTVAQHLAHVCYTCPHAHLTCGDNHLHFYGYMSLSTFLVSLRLP